MHSPSNLIGNIGELQTSVHHAPMAACCCQRSLHSRRFAGRHLSLRGRRPSCVHCACPQARTVGPQVCLLANLISWQGGWEVGRVGRRDRRSYRARSRTGNAGKEDGEAAAAGRGCSSVLPSSSLPVIPSHVLSLRRCESQREREKQAA